MASEVIVGVVGDMWNPIMRQAASLAENLGALDSRLDSCLKTKRNTSENVRTSFALG